MDKSLVSALQYSRRQRRRALILSEVFGLMCILILEGVATYHLGMRGFDTYDMSIVADGGYRIFSGQLPYRDFHMPMGPVVFYLQAAVFAIVGGFSWQAVILHAAVMGVLATTLIYFLLRLHLGLLPSLAFACIAALTFYMPIAYPWHDQTAFFFYLVAVSIFGFAGTHAHRLHSKATFGLAGLSGLALTVGIFSKHNIGLAALVLTIPLWLLVPLTNEDRFANRLIRLCTCLTCCLLSVLIVSAYFQSKGPFFADILSSAGQLRRLPALLTSSTRGNDFRLSSFPYSLDIWMLVSTVLVWGVVFLANLTNTLQHSGIVGMIISALGVSYVARKTGGGDLRQYASLLGLPLGLWYALLSRIENSRGAFEIGRRKAAALCLATGFGAMLLFLAGLSHRSDARPGRILLAGRWSLQWAGLLLGLLISAVFLYGTSRRLERASRRVAASNLIKVPYGMPLRILVLVVAFFLGWRYVRYDVQRSVWSSYPEVQGELLPFTNVRALDGLHARSEMVRDFEELVSWFRPKLGADESLKEGNIYIFPAGQLLYGALGVESFRNVHLWYHRGLTYSRADPDTRAIRDRLPEYVILHQYGMSYIREGDRLKENLGDMPELQSLLEEQYVVAARLHGFTVLQRANTLQRRTPLRDR